MRQTAGSATGSFLQRQQSQTSNKEDEQKPQELSKSQSTNSLHTVPEKKQPAKPLEVKKEATAVIVPTRPPAHVKLNPIEQKQPKVNNNQQRAPSKDKEATSKQTSVDDENKYALALVPVNTTADNDTTTSTCTDLVPVPDGGLNKRSNSLTRRIQPS